MFPVIKQIFSDDIETENFIHITLKTSRFQKNITNNELLRQETDEKKFCILINIKNGLYIK